MGSLSLGVFGSEITDVRFMEKELVLLGCILLDCRLCDMLWVCWCVCLVKQEESRDEYVF